MKITQENVKEIQQKINEFEFLNRQIELGNKILKGLHLLPSFELKEDRIFIVHHNHGFHNDIFLLAPERWAKVRNAIANLLADFVNEDQKKINEISIEPVDEIEKTECPAGFHIGFDYDKYQACDHCLRNTQCHMLSTGVK